MNTQRNTTGNGLTGFWMLVGPEQNVKVVNGTMYKLLSGRNAVILTHILSPHLRRQFLRSRLYANRKNRRADNRKSSYPRTYGVIGLQIAYARRGWVSSTTLRELRARRALADMLRNTYSSLPFSRLIGLKDGNVLDTLKAFQGRRRE